MENEQRHYTVESPSGSSADLEGIDRRYGGLEFRFGLLLAIPPFCFRKPEARVRRVRKRNGRPSPLLLAFFFR